jgi:radical SAM PhpK family P-methyltransferase
MKKQTDCLLVGPHEMNFVKYEKMLRVMGINTIIYKDLNLQFVRYNNKPFRSLELFELFSNNSNGPVKQSKSSDLLSGAIVYLGSYLARRNFTFDYINSYKNQINEFAEKLQNDDILTIALISTVYFTPLPIKELITFIRKYNSKVKIIIGGPYIWTQVRLLSEYDLNSTFKSINADFYVDSSQGEATLVEIIRALKNNLPIDRINNIYFKNGDQYIKTPLKSENNKLEENMVDWSLFSNNLQKQVYVRVSLSCLFKCSFCDFPARMGKYQDLSVEYVERELNGIQQTGKVTSVRFIDDTLNIPKKRFENILRMMIRNKYSFKWSSFLRCQYVDKEIIKLMSESGCEAVHLGIESGNAQLLKNMNKKSTIEQYEKGLQFLNEYKIISFASFVIGFPGETEDTIKDTIDFIENNKPTFYRLHLWYCSPLTPIWKEKEKYGLSKWDYNWTHNTMDAIKALELMKNMITNIKNSIYCPMNPEYVTFFLHQGYSLEQMKDFLMAFNDGLKEKIVNNSQKEINPEIIEKMKSSISKF